MQSENTVHDSTVEYIYKGGKIVSGLKQSKIIPKRHWLPFRKTDKNVKGSKKKYSGIKQMYISRTKKILHLGTVSTTVYFVIEREKRNH